MASSATSLHFLSISPQTLSLSKPFVPVFSSVSFPASSLKSLFSRSCSTIGLFGATSSSSYVSRFVRRNVSISSEFDQIGALDEDEPPRPPRFSEDLKLFVGNLPFSADSSVLAELFQRAGNVEMVEVIYDKITGRSRGFGFVTMSTVEEVEAAAQKFDGYELEGRQLRVNFGQGGPSRVNSRSAPPRRDNSSFRGSRGGSSFDDSNRIYVGNLAWGVDNLALETLFSEQGKVLDAKVIYDRDTGRSRGFGFVTYSNADEVNNAVDSLNGVDLNGREIRVSPAESRTRSEF